MLIMSVASCSTDDLLIPSGLGPDGELSVTLAIPETDKVNTRADADYEYRLNDLRMLIYSSRGFEANVPYSDLDVTGSKDKYVVKYSVDQQLRTRSDLKFYFIANAPSDFPTGSISESELKSPTATAQFTSSDMVMSGYADLAAIRSGSSVALRRNAAKVIVRDGVKTASGIEPGNTCYGFDVYGTAKSSSPAAAIIQDVRTLPEAVKESPSAFANCMDAKYLHPTSNKGRSAEIRPYLIVKAPYDNVDYYYRVEFEQVNVAGGKTTVTPLNLMSNHEYRVLVNEVKGPGDTTPLAASANPTSVNQIDVTIYDVCPQSYNMVSDGTRELGVSHEVVHNGNPTNAAVNPGSAEYLYVKLYSPDDSEYPSENNAFAGLTLACSESWLRFGNVEPVDEADVIGSAQGNQASTRGRLYRVPLNFITNNTPGNLDAVVSVRWQGLSREVRVNWIREFDGKDLCNVALRIKNPAENSVVYTAADYWTFLQETVKGVKVSENNDNVRDAGLHFPLGFGIDSNKLWSYEYTVVFKDLNDGRPFDWKLKAEGVAGIQLSQTSGKNVTGNVTVTVTLDPTIRTWDYQVGTLTFLLKSPQAEDVEDNWSDYSIGLYHCGFFDNPQRFRVNKYGNKITPVNHTVDGRSLDQFYYYEVRKGPDGESYWLDRNLGSNSAAYYIESSGDITYYGDSDAAGAYYRAARYNVGSSPEMYADLCPPGFEIPTVETWNALRNSLSFVMRQSGTYYQAQFTDSNGNIVYFPRARYFDANSTKTGESRAGYYWTRTAASGLEKDQIGNWLRYLKLSGSIASYDNAEVEGRNGSRGFAMSVRCVRRSEASDTQYRTHFNVAGATHVFLYSLDDPNNPNSTRNPVTNWPGQVIGNYQSMTVDQYFDFVYNSPNTRPEQFYVMFTFRDADGIWHTMSKGNNGQTVYSRDKKPSELQGWKVVGDTWKNPSGGTVTTSLGGFWKCSYNATNNTATVTFTNISPLSSVYKRNFRINWDKGSSWGLDLWNVKIVDKATGRVWYDGGSDGWEDINGTTWFHKEFSVAVEGSKSKFDSMQIYVEFYNSDHTYTYRKSWAEGVINLSWFGSSDTSTNEYGKGGGELWVGDMTRL